MWFFFILVQISGFFSPHYSYSAAPPQAIEIYGNHIFTDDAIMKIAGVELDQKLSNLDLKRNLETSNFFSYVEVRREGSTLVIVVREKTSWFVLPYFSTDSDSTIYGFAAGDSGLGGGSGSLLGRAQSGSHNNEASILYRDEFFLDSFWIGGMSLDYENELHSIYSGRDIQRRMDNKYYGGSLQTGYHFSPTLVMGFNTYVEEHHFEELNRSTSMGLQLSHRLLLDLGVLHSSEGLVRGHVLRPYIEGTNPASTFHFLKLGLSGQASAYLNGDFDWIIKPKFEWGSNLPRYQLFEVGGAKLRSFPSQAFRDSRYFSLQNDFLLAAWDFWKLKFRPLVYMDWAYVENGGRLGLGTGFQIFFRNVTVPAVQVFGGYGFHPDGFSIMAAIGPQF